MYRWLSLESGVCTGHQRAFQFLLRREGKGLSYTPAQKDPEADTHGESSGFHGSPECYSWGPVEVSQHSSGGLQAREEAPCPLLLQRSPL